MRVTDSSSYEGIRKTLTSTREKMAKAQEAAGSGLRVQKPSDDPVAAAAARRETSRKTLAEAGMKATEQASAQLEGTDEALGSVSDALASVRELAVQGSTGSFSDENRRNAAFEVRKIRDQMVALGNTNVAGKYVFAGYADQSPAFDASGSFVGDASTKEVQAMPGVRVPASIDGKTAFGVGEPDDLFTTLDQLATALESNDVSGVRASLTGIDKNENRVLSARSQVGAMMDGVQVANAVADRHAFRATLEKSRLVEADEITAAADLMQAKSALEKAVAVAGQIQVGGLLGGK